MRVMTVAINVLKDIESRSPRRKSHLLGAGVPPIADDATVFVMRSILR